MYTCINDLYIVRIGASILGSVEYNASMFSLCANTRAVQQHDEVVMMFSR